MNDITVRFWDMAEDEVDRLRAENKRLRTALRQAAKDDAAVWNEAIEACIAAQPCTAENPREDAYQHGRFNGVMDYQRAMKALKRRLENDDAAA